MSQQLVYDSKVEKYDEQTGDLHMRTFGIAEDLITANNWTARDVLKYGNTFVGRWIVDHEKSKGVHNKYTNLKKWLADSQKAAIATITAVDVNDKTGALDVIYKVTDPDSKSSVLQAMREGKPIKWKFSSPAIWGHKLRRDPNTGMIIYDEWEGVHVAVFSNKVNPAFSPAIAQINENVCIGGIQCANELAAVAIKLEIDDGETLIPIPGISEKEKNFIFDKFAAALNHDKKNMSAEDGNNKTKTVPYEEYVRAQESIKSLESKYNESLKVNETQTEKLKTVQTEKDDFKGKLEARETEDRKKFFTENFSKFIKDENQVKEKVDLFVEKKYTEDDFTKLYGNMVKEAEEQAEKDSNKKDSPNAKAGVAAKDNSQMDKSLRENIDIALAIANQRKRVF